MSLSQASPDRAAGTARSWEASAPATEKSDGAPTPAGGMLTLAGATAFLRRNARKIGSLALILFTAGIVVLQIIPVRYAATALVLVDPRELHVTADQDVLPGIGQDAAALQSLIEIAKSDGFLRPLIEKLKIADDDDIAGSEQNRLDSQSAQRCFRSGFAAQTARLRAEGEIVTYTGTPLANNLRHDRYCDFLGRFGADIEPERCMKLIE